MTDEEYHELNYLLKPIVEKIISNNYCFCGIDEKIKWGFVITDSPSILATCSRTTNVISVDIYSLYSYYESNNLIEAEYFIVHEMRHVFQHIQIKKFKNNEEVDVSKELIERWIFESEHYEKAIDESGKENEKYFLQDSELDAYAFSYAVMKYRYGEINVYVPPVYKEEFNEIVNDFLDGFKKANLQ